MKLNKSMRFETTYTQPFDKVLDCIALYCNRMYILHPIEMGN